MIDSTSFALFSAASLALILAPGPAVLYIVARSIDQGRLAGLVSVLGISVGTLVHVLAAALGISALLAASALAFSIIKYAGAVYLVYLGLHKLFIEKTHPAEVEGPPAQTLRRIFTQGFVVNLLNPKLALFFLAFLPQFIDPVFGPVGPQFLLLGITFTVIALISDSLYALLAGTARDWLRARPGFTHGQKYASGGVYVALGVAAALKR
jgi:threonine/homoserine/homoserine lactone efflux protein